MSRSPYKKLSRSPYKKLSRTPYKKCLDLLTDKTLDFCYNVVAQTGSIIIEAFVAAVIREGGWYEEPAADATLAEVSQWVVGCFGIWGGKDARLLAPRCGYYTDASWHAPGAYLGPGV
jgi:hypothetical protein